MKHPWPRKVCLNSTRNIMATITMLRPAAQLSHTPTTHLTIGVC